MLVCFSRHATVQSDKKLQGAMDLQHLIFHYLQLVDIDNVSPIAIPFHPAGYVAL